MSTLVGRTPKGRGTVAARPDPDGFVRAYRGELGLAIRYWYPHLAALGPVAVEVEEGHEALVPFAREVCVVPRVHDDTRQKGPGIRFPQKRFVPDPHMWQGITADVVICPRLRRHGPSKNWPHWESLTELPGVFAAGAADSSYDVRVPRAWDFPRPLDASIEAIRSARLVIATDAGLAHLAVLCGTPLLLITYRGLVSPGPVVSAEGRTIQAAYWPVKFAEYYEAANHTNAPLEMIDGWERPEAVLTRAKELLGC